MNQKPLVFIIHTSFVSVSTLNELFKEIGPEIQLRHIVDDSLLPEVLDNGGVTINVRSRMCDYFKAAETAGADLIFNQCSSVGEVADYASKMVRTPVIKVDKEMARVACKTGKKIGVIATLETTLDPTCRLIESTAMELEKEVVISRSLVNGAFEHLINGNAELHNNMVVEAITELSESVDVVVCAQGSMASILIDLESTNVPVLTSPRLGVESVVNFIQKK